MDLQQSKRIFNVQATDVSSARNWWTQNTLPECWRYGTVENNYEAWLVKMGGGSASVGKYDIYNGFEWYYQPFDTNIVATVADDGTTDVRIDHVAWGTEALLGRWFYWGNASYVNNYLDDSKARGWWGMEVAWFDDFVFTGSLGVLDFDFNFNTQLQYHFLEQSLPGSDGYLNKKGDVPFWQWGPALLDYVDSRYSVWSTSHPYTELDRYAGKSYLHSVPGTWQYNKSLAYDYVPNTWNLKPGHKWIFMIPTGDVAFHDPNLTPAGADPHLGEYVQYLAKLVLTSPLPNAYSTWNPTTGLLTVRGPVVTGCAPGTPTGGYPLESCPAFNFVPG
jgi:hypothetical protein